MDAISISVVYIKEELDNAAFDIIVEPAMNLSFIKEELDDAVFDVSIEPARNSFIKKGGGGNETPIVEKQNQTTGANDLVDKLIIRKKAQAYVVSKANILDVVKYEC